jgi:hypothetical protein
VRWRCGSHGGIEYMAQQCFRPFMHWLHAMMLWCAILMINSSWVLFPDRLRSAVESKEGKA